jgi:hypothetical protein
MMLQLDLAALTADGDSLEQHSQGNIQSHDKAETEQIQALIVDLK